MQVMLSFKAPKMSIIVYLCVVAASASRYIERLAGSARLSSMYRIYASEVKHMVPAGTVKHAHDDRHNTSSTMPSPVRRNRNRNRGAQNSISLLKSKSKARTGSRKVLAGSRAATPTRWQRQNPQPTPEPTGEASASTTVFVIGSNDFALLLPRNAGEMVSDTEEDGIAYCTDGSACGNPFPDRFITGASYSAADDGSYVQITGCMDVSKFKFADGDDGGQFDVRYPNGAQCTFGGYGASFIELVEPSANRFCLRCCKSADDQENCNSHQDRAGCPLAVPGIYQFGQVDCS